MNDRLTHIDLFAGIGGFSLASRWAGFRTIAFCEKDEWCQQVLKKDFGAEVVCGRDRSRKWTQNEPCSPQGTAPKRIANPCSAQHKIMADSTRRENHRRKSRIMGSTTESGECINPAANAGREDGRIPLYPDIKTFPGHLYRGATLLTGGFPCQPFSCAGKRKGTEDDRDLWPFMFDVIKDARPTWIIGENVAGFVKMELDRSISDLESEGYAVRTFIIPACATDAKHRRDRCWIVAHNNAVRCDVRGVEGQGIYGNEQTRSEVVTGNQDVADSEKIRLQRIGVSGEQEPRAHEGQGLSVCCSWPDENEWFAQSGMGRVASRIPRRVDRLKGLGNAIVPQVAYEIINALARVEREGKGMDENYGRYADSKINNP